MQFLIDMNLSRRWVDVLAGAGYRATYWRDIGPATASDEQIMAFARSRGLVVMTQDLDFGELLASNNAAGPSVLQVRGGDAMPDKSGSRVLEAISRFADRIEAGALVTVQLSSAKVRVLPIARSKS